MVSRSILQISTQARRSPQLQMRSANMIAPVSVFLLRRVKSRCLSLSVMIAPAS